MDHADGIIVCSATYNMRETALLKNFFDHLCFMLHRPHFFKFYRDIASGRLHSLSVMLFMPYNLFRGMSLAYVPGTEYETEDGIYWTDENRKRKVYAPEVKVSWWKKPIGQMFYWIGKLAGSMKSMTVTYRKKVQTMY